MKKNIFIAATSQNEGKTSLCLGLIKNLKQKVKDIGFIKPVGQRYLIAQSCKVDEDALVIAKLCNLNIKLEHMSPIAITRGFTAKYIQNRIKNNLDNKIIKAYEGVSKGKKIVIVEGTGHAGVGSIFNLSNADVAKLLNAKVLLVSSGGLGRPIDEILLNKALFEKRGVEILGVVINKVIPEKYNKIKNLIEKRLSLEGIETLGVIPFRGNLTQPTMGQLKEEMNLKILTGEKWLDNIVSKIVVGAMEPHDALNYMKEKSLVITPGDREDIILTATSSHLVDKHLGKISGIILTGHITPHKSIINVIKKSGIPVLIASDDTYTVASNVHDLTVKLRPTDLSKAEVITKLVGKYVDIDRIISKINNS